MIDDEKPIREALTAKLAGKTLDPVTVSKAVSEVIDENFVIVQPEIAVELDPAVKGRINIQIPAPVVVQVSPGSIKAKA